MGSHPQIAIETNLRPKAGVTLADLTAPGLIVSRLRGKDTAGVIQELTEALKRERCVPDLALFYDAVMKRESQASTDMGAGMAFPHARLPGLRELSFALGHSAEPLAWGVTATRRVRLVFLIAVPKTDSAQYLMLVSALVRLAKDGGLVQQLHAAQNPSQVFGMLQQVRLRTQPLKTSAAQIV